VKRIWATGAIPMGAPVYEAVNETEKLRESQKRMSTWMTAVGLGHNIGGQGADGVDGQLVCVVLDETHDEMCCSVWIFEGKRLEFIGWD
jgi:hypothetical protein